MIRFRADRACLALIVVAIAASACGGGSDGDTAGSSAPEPASTSGFQTYSNPVTGFAITYPPEWTVEEDELRAVVTFEAPNAGGGDVPPSVSVTREALPSSSITLDEYAEAGTRQLEQAVPGFVLVSEGAATLGGLPAKRIEYTGTQGELELHWQQVFAVAEGAAFLLTYVAERDAYTTHLAEAEAMFESFELTEQG